MSEFGAGPFHLFSGDAYYPAGGMGDYRGVFASPEAAAAAVGDWAHLAVSEGGRLRPVASFREGRWRGPDEWTDYDRWSLGLRDEGGG